ncbi:MAG: hypothetical protein ACRBBN_21385 [Methyloligellaceae bacterium]
MKYHYHFIPLLLAGLLASEVSHASGFPIYPPKSICEERGAGQFGKIDVKKLVYTAIGPEVLAKIFTKLKPGQKVPSLIELVYLAKDEDSDVVVELISAIRHPGEHYIIRKKGAASSNKVDAVHFISNPSLYYTECVNWPEKKVGQNIAEVRKKVDDTPKSFGKDLIIRSGINSLTGDIDTGKAASFSISRDGVKKNTVVETKVAVAKRFVTHLATETNDFGEVQGRIPLKLFPYFRYEGKFSSKSGARNVDNLAVGLRADISGIEIANIVDGTLSFRGEYVTDSIAESEIVAGEVVWSPFFTGSLGETLPLQRAVWPLGFEGPWIFMDLSARYRFGDVYDPGQKASLLETNQYQRVGGRFYAVTGFTGSDFLSKLTASVEYWYFEDLEKASGVKRFDHLEADVSYKFTKNTAISLSYEKGRNVDTLEEVDLIKGALTIKFGEFDDGLK